MPRAAVASRSASVMKFFLLLLTLLPHHGNSADSDCTVRWMWGDAHIAGSHSLARQNPLSWSPYKTAKETVVDLQREERVSVAHGGAWDNRKKPLDIVVKCGLNDEIVVDTQRSSLLEAIHMIRKWKHEDTAAQEKQRIEAEYQFRRYLVQWMWGDAGIISQISRLNAMRWSTWKSPEETILELRRSERSDTRPVRMRVKRIYGDDIYDDGQPWDVDTGSVAEAMRDIEKLSETEFKMEGCVRNGSGATATTELEAKVVGNELITSVVPDGYAVMASLPGQYEL